MIHRNIAPSVLEMTPSPLTVTVNFRLEFIFSQSEHGILTSSLILNDDTLNISLAHIRLHHLVESSHTSQCNISPCKIPVLNYSWWNVALPCLWTLENVMQSNLCRFITDCFTLICHPIYNLKRTQKKRSKLSSMLWKMISAVVFRWINTSWDLVKL